MRHLVANLCIKLYFLFLFPISILCYVDESQVSLEKAKTFNPICTETSTTPSTWGLGSCPRGPSSTQGAFYGSFTRCTVYSCGTVNSVYIFLWTFIYTVIVLSISNSVYIYIPKDFYIFCDIFWLINNNSICFF